MKFSVTQENLLKGLNIVNRVATTRATLPVLGNILFQTNKNQLKLITTDLEIAIDTYINASIEIEGAITIPARTITDFITTNTDSTIEFSLKDTVLTAKSQHFTATFLGIDAIEFPSVPIIDKPEAVSIPSLLLKEAILQTVFATTHDETRPILNGVALYISNKELKLVATDSYRLAEKRIPLESSIKHDTMAIVPARTLVELSRLISDDIPFIVIALNSHQMTAKCGESHITSRLIEGTFPAYESIIPNKLTTTLTINRLEFINALKMASLFSRDSAYNVTFNIKEQELTLKALSSQIGTSVSTVSAVTTGSNMSIAFNARFIIDALNVISGDTVQLLLEPPKDNHWFPGIIKSTQDHEYQYVIMPLRTESPN